MRIAFASDDDKGLDSTLAQHFGRCAYYVFVDVDGKKVKKVRVKKSPFGEGHSPGAVPGFIAQEEASVIVAGGMGPKAIEWFHKLGIKPLTTSPRRVRQVLEEYLEGRLSGAEACGH